LRGGIDVLNRALSPSLPLRPGFIEIDLNLPTEGMRVLLAWTTSLLPGTASVALIEKRLVVHALFQDHSIHAELQRLETVIRELT
jgi:multicomponent Na+:H+ antiporter subunit E